jgi:hypothetical protein
VELEAVDLGDEALLAPEEVDLEVAKEDVCLGLRESRRADETDEGALGFGAGSGGGVTRCVEAPKEGCSWAAGVIRDRVAELSRAEQVAMRASATAASSVSSWTRRGDFAAKAARSRRVRRALVAGMPSMAISDDPKAPRFGGPGCRGVWPSAGAGP